VQQTFPLIDHPAVKNFNEPIDFFNEIEKTVKGVLKNNPYWINP